MSLLPLWEKVPSPTGRANARPMINSAKADEGFVSAERDPSPGSHLTMRATLSHKPTRGEGNSAPITTIYPGRPVENLAAHHMMIVIQKLHEN